MPTGKPINWSQYDQDLIQNLKSHTIKSWCNKYAPNISHKAVGTRAQKLGLRPLKYKPTQAHKKQISTSLSKETPEIIQLVKDNIDQLSRKELSKLIGMSQARLNDLIVRHNIKLSEIGRKRSRESSRKASLGKEPWNKGKKLSEEHLIKMAEGRQKMSGRLSKL